MGALIAAFCISLLFGVIWILLTWPFKAMRRSPEAQYSVAALLAALPPFISIDGPEVKLLIGAAAAIAVFYWQYKRAKRKLSGIQ